VAQRPAPALCAALAQLDDAGLLFCRGMPPQSSYQFKHALAWISQTQASRSTKIGCHRGILVVRSIGSAA